MISDLLFPLLFWASRSASASATCFCWNQKDQLKDQRAIRNENNGGNTLKHWIILEINEEETAIYKDYKVFETHIWVVL